MTQGPPKRRSGLVLGINGVGLEDGEDLLAPVPPTFEGSFKRYSIYNNFINELVDGGDGFQVQQHIL